MSDVLPIKLQVTGDAKAVAAVRKEIEQLAAASAKTSTLASAASAKQAAAYSKIQQAASAAATADQRLATETQKTTAAKNTAAAAAQRLATEEQRTARELANTSAAQMRAEKTALQLAAAQQRAARAGQNGGLGPALPRTLDGLSGTAATVAKGFLTIQAAQKGFEFAKLGADAYDITRAFEGLALSAKTTSTAMLTSLRAAANGTIRDTDLIKSANLGLLLTSGKIAKDLPEIIQISRATAKSTGQDINFVYDSLIRGIARGSPKIIDNAGITFNAEAAFQAYAKSIGKAADQLTGAEQQQATLNAVLERGREIVKTVGLNAEGTATSIDKATIAVRNLGDRLAQKIAPFIGEAASGLNNLLNTGGVAPGAVAAGDALQGNLVEQTQSYDQYTASVKAANNAVFDAIKKTDPLGALYAKTFLGLSALTPAQFAYAQSLIATGTASTQAFAQARGLSDVSDQFTRALNSATTAALGNRTELTALAPKILDVANQSDHNRTAVNGLLTAYAEGRQSLPGLIAALNGLSHGHDIARLAAQEEEREIRRLGVRFEAIVPQAHAAADAIKKLNSVGLPHLTDKGIAGSGVAGGVAGRLTDPRNLAAGNAGVEQLDDVLFENRLKKAKTNAEKIRLLREQEAATADPMKRAQIEGQIIDLQSQKVSGLQKEANLQESIYDSINKQRQAQLDLVGLSIDNQRATAKEADEARRLQAALDSGRQSAPRQDAIRLRLAEIQNDQAQRTLKMEETQATAQGTITNGRLLQSQPATAPVPATVPISAIPQATAPIAAVGGNPILEPLPAQGSLIPPTVNVTLSLTIMDGKVTQVNAGGASLTVLLNSARQSFASGGTG